MAVILIFTLDCGNSTLKAVAVVVLKMSSSQGNVIYFRNMKKIIIENKTDMMISEALFL